MTPMVPRNKQPDSSGDKPERPKKTNIVKKDISEIEESQIQRPIVESLVESDNSDNKDKKDNTDNKDNPDNKDKKEGTANSDNKDNSDKKDNSDNKDKKDNSDEKDVTDNKEGTNKGTMSNDVQGGNKPDDGTPHDPYDIFLRTLLHFSKTNISLPFLIVKHSLIDIFDNPPYGADTERNTPPFRMLRVSGCEISDCNIIQFLRKSIFCKLNVLKTVHEGEIVHISLIDRRFKITLRSLKGSQTVTLTDQMYEMVLAERLLVGDIVHIELNSNIIRKIGRADTKLDCDIELGRIMPLPREEVEKIRYVNQVVSFYELDAWNRRDMNEAQLKEYRMNEQSTLFSVNGTGTKDEYGKEETTRDSERNRNGHNGKSLNESGCNTKSLNESGCSAKSLNQNDHNEKSLSEKSINQNDHNENDHNENDHNEKSLHDNQDNIPPMYGLSESVCWLRACYETDRTIIEYLEKGFGEMETGILLIEDCHLMERKLIIRVLNILESARFVPIVLFCTDNSEYIRENKEIFRNINCVVLHERNTDSLLKHKIQQMPQESAEYIKEIARERGDTFALSIIKLVGILPKEELKSIVEQLSS